MGKGSGKGSGDGFYLRGGHAVIDYEPPTSALHENRSTAPQHIPTSLQLQHHEPRGLQNVGNTCYANAALQCLLNTALSSCLLDPRAATIFRRYSSNPNLLAEQSSEEQSTRRLEMDRLNQKCEWLTAELKALALEYHREAPPAATSWLSNYTLVSPTRVVNPASITRCPDRLSKCLRPYQQEDAHEFLRALLGTLVMNGHNRQLSSLFDGLLESAVTCQTCRRPSLTRDRYMDLSLDIGKDHVETLYDALDEFTQTEVLSGDNKVYCERCQCKRTATKGLRLATAPSILVTHFKRFAFDNYGNLYRLNKKVKFPLRLEIGDFMSKVNKARPPAYELVAVLVHQGRTCDSGHYLAYVKSNGDWFCCNDSLVHKVSVDEVLNQEAYICLYEVAQMRANHGYPSPSKVPMRPSTSASCFSNLFCGMDVFTDCCSAVSSHARDALDEACLSTVHRKPVHKRMTAHEDWETVATLSDDSYAIRRTTSSGGVRRKKTLPRRNSFSQLRPLAELTVTPPPRRMSTKVVTSSCLPPRPDKK